MASRDTKKVMLSFAEEQEMMMKEVLGTYEGRCIIFAVVAMGNIYGEYSVDPAVAQRELGRRDVALQLLNDVLTAMPDAYILMQQEADARVKVHAEAAREEEEDNG